MDLSVKFIYVYTKKKKAKACGMLLSEYYCLLDFLLCTYGIL